MIATHMVLSVCRVFYWAVLHNGNSFAWLRVEGSRVFGSAIWGMQNLS